jgi:hypothetical protein
MTDLLHHGSDSYQAEHIRLMTLRRLVLLVHQVANPGDPRKAQP